jgi:hypothetical protein
MMTMNPVRIAACIALTLVAGRTPMHAQTSDTVGKKQTTATRPRRKSPPPKRAPASVELQLEPKAIEILKAASSRLASARTVSFVAVDAYETLSRQGAPLVYANRSEVTLQRPDKLRVIQTGDGPASEIYYDGKVMMAFAPADNAVAVASAPPTIDLALKAFYDQAAIYFPFTDLIVSDPYGDLAPGLKHAYYVGQSNVIGGTTTDIVAYAGDGVFVQMWVGAEDKLPRLMHAIFLNDPDELRHNLVLSDWQLDADVPPDAFTTSKAATARRMEFAHPHPETASAARPAR